MRAPQAASARSFPTAPKIHIARLARVMATLRRRTSVMKPGDVGSAEHSFHHERVEMLG